MIHLLGKSLVYFLIISFIDRTISQSFYVKCGLSHLERSKEIPMRLISITHAILCIMAAMADCNVIKGKDQIAAGLSRSDLYLEQSIPMIMSYFYYDWLKARERWKVNNNNNNSSNNNNNNSNNNNNNKNNNSNSKNNSSNSKDKKIKAKENKIPHPHGVLIHHAIATLFINGFLDFKWNIAIFYFCIAEIRILLLNILELLKIYNSRTSRAYKIILNLTILSYFLVPCLFLIAFIIHDEGSLNILNPLSIVRFVLKAFIWILNIRWALEMSNRNIKFTHRLFRVLFKTLRLDRIVGIAGNTGVNKLLALLLPSPS